MCHIYVYKSNLLLVYVNSTTILKGVYSVPQIFLVIVSSKNKSLDQLLRTWKWLFSKYT